MSCASLHKFQDAAALAIDAVTRQETSRLRGWRRDARMMHGRLASDSLNLPVMWGFRMKDLPFRHLGTTPFFLPTCPPTSYVQVQVQDILIDILEFFTLAKL